ncbi:uncharacterized protein EV420DRAFT_1682587 [Desarmillaria tabescens]|uniref:Heterokaryon incompatibility domain-containing protein n=1 Tax=Armillaria tabescens TaxID=1929756 RepID=A0AA39N5P2_ARMTA|nr:uncharacterized protein EV420DRAFT_1682587 [Desarmillaria tabescens]KAK0458359.1 hypothetical protein EV420DRAFT_1682587 [Desarmillaria tabescens]
MSSLIWAQAVRILGPERAYRRCRRWIFITASERLLLYVQFQLLHTFTPADTPIEVWMILHQDILGSGSLGIAEKLGIVGGMKHKMTLNNTFLLPEVTISASTEINQAEEEIVVPLQRKYTGAKPVISASLANTPCTTLGTRGLLERLNTTLGTSHSLETPSLSSVLEVCIWKNYDFGTAYSCLRRVWYTDDWSIIPGELRKCDRKDRKMRRNALDGNCVVEPNTCPRRAWDLYKYPDPISHAWVGDGDRVDVWTPINGHEWPVPIPRGTNLNLIRIEMLNLGREYVWLDVLCLRQKGGLREYLRAEEWKLDVPTIGQTYGDVDVFCYLSGLGRPLSVMEGYFDNDRSWFNRAWTLQEVGYGRTICGVTPDGPLNAKPDKNGNYETETLTTFRQQIRDMRQILHEIFEMLEEMRCQVSTNPVDKIAGMAFLLGPYTIPAYYEHQSPGDAWTALVNTIMSIKRGFLFFQYPEPGDAGTKWRPSWDQVMTKPLPRDEHYFTAIHRKGKDDECEAALCIEKGFVQGLAVEGVPGADRHGRLHVEDMYGTKRVFNIIARHQYPIPEDMYTLIGSEESMNYSSHCWKGWVVGRRLSDDRFEKVSVFQMVDDMTEDMINNLAEKSASIFWFNSTYNQRQSSVYIGDTRSLVFGVLMQYNFRNVEINPPHNLQFAGSHHSDESVDNNVIESKFRRKLLELGTTYVTTLGVMAYG